MVSVYIAHRKAATMRPAAPATARGVPARTPAVRSCHFETKPQNSGMPVRDSAPTVKQKNVTGIFRPTPSISQIWDRPLWCRNAPAHRNSVILMTPWNSIWASPPANPAGVRSMQPYSMYERLLAVEYASRLFSFHSRRAIAAAPTSVTMAAARQTA